MLLPGEILIHEGNAHQFLAPVVNGEQKAMGMVPRDFGKHPCGSFLFAPMSKIQRIPRSEWKSRIKERRESKSLLSDLRMIGNKGAMIPSRDQDGYGYCWGHSTTTCAIALRAREGQPYVDLSAFAICCIIKNYRNEGGYNAQSVEFLAKRGCPTSEFWPQQSTSHSNDNPRTWENAALHKVSEWDDIPEGDYDLQMTYSMLGCPYALDLNWWSHSIGAIDPVDGEAGFHEMRAEETGKLLTVQEFDKIWQTDLYEGAFGTRIWNSWGDSWSANGTSVLTEAKARNNGAIALRAMTISAA